jgi:hypothetical protein
MNNQTQENRKAELRKVVLDILTGKESVFYEPNQFAHLALGIAEVEERRLGHSSAVLGFHESGARLTDEDQETLQEIFWVLIIERIISPELNEGGNPFGRFRLHSALTTPGGLGQP